jgi:hypothetical protein
MLLTPEELCERWKGSVTVATLAAWRARDIGPAYVKIGRQVLYRLADVEKYEREKTK